MMRKFDMKTEKNLKDRFGIFRSFGWKKNLLAAAAGFLICVLLDVITAILFTNNVIGTFKPVRGSDSHARAADGNLGCTGISGEGCL